jgi:hypothetical protein
MRAASALTGPWTTIAVRVAKNRCGKNGLNSPVEFRRWRVVKERIKSFSTVHRPCNHSACIGSEMLVKSQLTEIELVRELNRQYGIDLQQYAGCTETGSNEKFSLIHWDLMEKSNA